MLKYSDMDVSMSTTMHSAMLEENPGVKATENLFDEFLSVCSSGAQARSIYVHWGVNWFAVSRDGNK